AKAKPAPPPRPAKRPGMGGRGPAPSPGDPTRDSAVSIDRSDQGSAPQSRAATPSTLAGGLAEALKHRHQTMNPKEEEEDDW
ncbi:hypothetical protein KEM55_009092, partial [Ascosphaera atra]